MLLSDWYANWKEKRLQAAVEKARSEGYEEGYAAGKTGTYSRTGSTVRQGQHPDGSARVSKSRAEKEKGDR